MAPQATTQAMARRMIDRQWFRSQLKEMRMSQADLARSIGMHTSALSNVLSGKRRLQFEEAANIAGALGRSVRDVLAAAGADTDYIWGNKISISGYVIAGDDIVLYDEHDPGYGLEEIEPPFIGYAGSVVKIKGDSMTPRFLNGEIIAFRPEGDIGLLIGKEVVAKLRDGRLVLKRLQRGSDRNTYTLVSINPMVPPIVNVELDWASPIDWHKPLT